MKKAFTLAEVLITLGIIGVVAAMTIPTLIQKHQKKVVISKLQKASSTIGQAYNMGIAEYGNYREAFDAYNPDIALEMFNKYYKPYMKISKIEKGEKGAFAYLTDGTALYFFRDWRDPAIEGWYNTYFIVCLTHKACKNVNESLSEIKKSLGKERFILYTSGRIPNYQLMKDGRYALIEQCKNGTGSLEACSALIGGDGWQIKDDYPIKF